MCFNIERLFSFHLSTFTSAVTPAKRVRPREIGKVPQPTGGLEWDERMTQMVLELLSHRTPPSCVSQNILTIAFIICPIHPIVKELPSKSFIRKCRSVLSYLTKLLAAYQLGKTNTHLQLHHDGTTRRQIALANLIIHIACLGGFKNVCLNSAILSHNETAVMQRDSILRTYREGRLFLK